MMDAAHSLRGLVLGALLGVVMPGCVQQAPPEMLRAVEDLDRELESARSMEYAPEEYSRFARHWVAFKERLQFEEDAIRWPWEPNRLVLDLEKIRQEGVLAAAAASQRREADRLHALEEVARIEERVRLLTAKTDEIGGRLVLGQRPVKTALMVHQAQAFLDAAHYRRSVEASRQASRMLDEQAVALHQALRRYTDPARVAAWQKMARRTIDSSRANRIVTIVVSKAEHQLTLYRNGRVVGRFPVRLGYNGILEKRRQGDGATPEGYYRVVGKRDHGQTRFYRALPLDYPNAEDRRRFAQARTERALPQGATIGGAIEIHGLEDEDFSATLGCLMLENPHMDRVFEASVVGTPVTVVGALTEDNPVALALRQLTRSWSAEDPPAALAIGPDLDVSEQEPGEDRS